MTIAAATGRSDTGRARTVRWNARGRGQGKRPPSMGHSASPGVPLSEARGDDQNRTGVDGFAGRCLTTRPRRLQAASVAAAHFAGDLTPRGRRVPARISAMGVVAVFNRKGGVGKTTTAVSVAAAHGAGRPAHAARRPRSAGLGRPRAGRGGGRTGAARARCSPPRASRRWPTRPHAALFRLGVLRRRPRAGRRRGGAARPTRRRRGRLVAGLGAPARALGGDGARRAARARRPVRRGAARRRRGAGAGGGRLPRARRAALDAGRDPRHREGARPRLRAARHPPHVRRPPHRHAGGRRAAPGAVRATSLLADGDPAQRAVRRRRAGRPAGRADGAADAARDGLRRGGRRAARRRSTARRGAAKAAGGAAAGGEAVRARRHARRAARDAPASRRARRRRRAG